MRLHRLLRNRAIGLARRTFAPLVARRTARTPDTLPLESVRRRLELLLAAMYGRPMHVGADTPQPTNAGDTAPDIRLPVRLHARSGLDAAHERYRLLAIEQAERLVRGTGAQPRPTDPLEHDLFELVEGASIDRGIVARAPGLAVALDASRRTELAARPPLHRVRLTERAIEGLVQATLDAALGEEVPGVPHTRTPEESRAWARATSADMRARLTTRMRYGGVRPVGLWNTRSAPIDLLPSWQSRAALPIGDMRSPSAPAESSSGRPVTSEGNREAVGAPSGDAAGATADAESPEKAGAPSTGSAPQQEAAAAPGGMRYREWDEYAGLYRPDEVTVRARLAPQTDDAWAAATLRTHAPLVRQIRARFAPLRAHRTRLRAQSSGDELDLDACVAAIVEMRRGRAPSDRLYRVTTPARRTLAIMLLVDVSGSTNAPLADGRTVLDVERMTLLLASEALDELGDPYAVLAFSSSGRHDVLIDQVKDFSERDASLVRRRVSALTAARNTRLGAAVRHATALLNAQPAERRLLLLLSDGQPNDVGGYQGSYAAADSRRAVLESRASGVHPFCLTVDREEQEYLPHLFGVNGYRILREPAQLPSALLQVVAHLLPR
jgi:nitric oxide reductase NorD protein